jgi:ubiquinone/menaquinone biosynthesis C-methylase UbiE
MVLRGEAAPGERPADGQAARGQTRKAYRARFAPGVPSAPLVLSDHRRTIMADVTPEPILQVFTGFLASKQLFVATEIGLFEQLASGPATLEELATRTAVPRRTLRIVADAMVALGLLERSDGQYNNRPSAATFLAGSGPVDLRPFISLGNELLYSRQLKFEEAIRTDQRILGVLDFDEHEQEVWSRGVEAATAGDAQALASGYDFTRHRRVLDLGGGTGSLLMAVLGRHPHLRATLFELPAAAAVARERLRDEPVRSRIEIATGDLLSAEIPEDHDVVVLAHVIHCFSRERNLELLRRVRLRVPSGARLLLVDFWTDPTHTQPLFAALMAGEFLLDAGGDVYSAEEASTWLRGTGWSMLEHAPLRGATSLIIAEAV